MPAVVGVVDGVDEAFLSSINDLALIRVEKQTACVRGQRLPAKRRLLVKTKLSVKTADHILVVHKLTVGPQETNERICFAQVTLQAENADGRILIKDSWIDAGTFVFAEVAWTVVRGE